MSEENIENIAKSESNLQPNFANYQLLSDININGYGLRNNISIPKKLINLYIPYTLNPQLTNLNTDFKLGKLHIKTYKANCHC